MSNSVPPNDGGEQFDGRPPTENTSAVPAGPQTPQRPRPERGYGEAGSGPVEDPPAAPPDDGWQRVENPWQRAAVSRPQPPGPSGDGVPARGFGRPPADWSPAEHHGSAAQQPMSQHGAQRPPAPLQSPVQRSSSQPGPGEPGRFGFQSREPADLPATVPADLKRRRSLIIGVVVALIVLALIAVLVTTILQRRGSAASGAQADAVQGYLSAVAAGDSERALGYLAERPDNAGLLTDKVLAASNKIAPITAISVSEPQKGSNTVQAWYKIGDQRYQQQFTVQARGDSYVLDGGTATADLSSLPKGLSYKLDGASIQRKTVALFPGSYRISADSRLYDLGQQSEFVAVVHDRLSISLTPRLTSTGQKSVKTAIDDAIKDCLASKKLKAGCGLTLTGNGPGSFTVKDGSIKRSLSKEASRQLDRLELITDDADPTLIRTTGISGNIRTEATCERDKSGKRKGKKTKDCILRGAGTSLDSPQVRVSGDELKVEWF